MITQEKAREFFEYRDGKLFWRKSPLNHIYVGERVGTTGLHGYRAVGIEKKIFYEHRIIFLYHYGYLPKIIDHIDKCKTNNCIENLRPVTHGANRQRGKLQGGTSQYRGVCWHFQNKKWRVRIQSHLKREHLGDFDNELEGALAYDKRAKELFGEYAGLNFGGNN